MTKISARNVYFVHVLLVAIEKYNFRSLFLLFEVISFEELIITNVSFRFSLLPSFSSFVCGWFCFGSCLFIAFCFARPDSPCGEGKGSLAREGRAATADARPSIATPTPGLPSSSSVPILLIRGGNGTLSTTKWSSLGYFVLALWDFFQVSELRVI